MMQAKWETLYMLQNVVRTENYRQERYNLIGEPTEEMMKEWKSLYGEFNEKKAGEENGN